MEGRAFRAWKHVKIVLFWAWWMVLSCPAYGQDCYYGEEVDYILSGTYEACATLVQVDSGKMMEFIRSVNETFFTYYAFYDIARDALDSIPLAYGNQYGYTVYNGTSAGQVDLAKELDGLHEDVKSNGANLTTFWEMSKIFDRLLDEHVSLNGDPFGAMGNVFGPTGFTYATYLSSMIINQTYTAASLDFKNNGTTDVMSLTWFDRNYELSKVQEIRTLNDRSPLEFLKYFTSIEGTTNNGMSFKAPGARINKLLNSNSGIISKELLTRQFYGNPAWFPSTIQVVFEDGGTDTWRAVVQNEGVYNVTEIQQRINTAGDLYRTVQAAIGIATDGIPLQRKKKTKLKTLPGISPSSRSTDQLAFQVGNGTAGAEYFGVVGMDDYVVLKVESFYEVALVTVINAWNMAVDMAQSRGIDKLILDLVQNGGGSGAAGYALTACMFPEASFDVIVQTYNFVYSDLFHVMNETVWPFLDATNAFFQEGNNIETLLEGMPDDEFNRIVKVSFAVDILLGDEDNRLTNLANQLNNSRTIESMAAYVSEVDDVLKNHNAVTGVKMDNAIQEPIQYAVRGGKNITLTGNVVLGLTEEGFNDVRKSCKVGPFTKYAVLGDGTGGSTACVVSTFLQQTTPNGVNGPPVISVSYGGTGDAETTPLKQFCGGSVLEPNLEEANVPLAILYLLRGMLNTTIAGDLRGRANTTFEAYNTALPSVPYFANSPMKMPVAMVYSNFMGSEAIPLEYINFPAEGYLRQWYTRTKFQDMDKTNATIRYGQEDLKMLYTETASRYLTDDPTSSSLGKTKWSTLSLMMLGISCLSLMTI